MKTDLVNNIILEPAREINVCYEADVVVVGGGPAGHSAAVAAARNGAKTVLVERYGHLGGMATGGLVIAIPHMSDGTKEQQIAGLCQEWVDRLDTVGGALHPKREELGSRDEKTVDYWSRFFSFVVDGAVRQSIIVVRELLKCVLNDMVEEAGVKLFLHSWGSQAIVNDGQVQGVTFESKSGRQAIQGKVIIDTTGDGDIFSSAGAEFNYAKDTGLRSSQLALVFRLGNVDFMKFSDFKKAEPQKYEESRKKIQEMTGITFLPLPSSRNDVMWVNNWVPGLSHLSVEDLTSVEVKIRKLMLPVSDYLRRNIPGFENCFILDTASQLGTRGSRRLIGEHVLTSEDLQSSTVYEDTIAVFPGLRRPVGEIGNKRHTYIPYRTLVPKKIEGLLVAGRCFSSDPVANNMYNLIPHCAAMGEAAGTAAALAVKHEVSPRQVDYKLLQKCLIKQGVPLPGV